MTSLSIAKLLEAQKPLEHRFKCHILLRGAAFETAPSRPVLMYVDLEGGENGLQQAMECIEDILLDCFPRSMHAKRILMYDLAVGNPELYRHEDGIVYQRDPRRLVDQMNWIWICVLPFPQNFDFHVLARILIGSKGNGISEIRGETSCDISVPKSPTQPRPFVYIAGEALSDVRACVGRTHKRFDRAMKKCKP